MQLTNILQKALATLLLANVISASPLTKRDIVSSHNPIFQMLIHR